MKLYAKSSEKELYKLYVTIELTPELEDGKPVVATITYKDSRRHKYVTDVNPDRIMNGPLSDFDQPLNAQLRAECSEFLADCTRIVQYEGFEIVTQYDSLDSKNSEYSVIVFGVDGKPYGEIIFNIRVSDHYLDNMKVPENVKQQAESDSRVADNSNEYIVWSLRNIVVGGVRNDTWQKALDRFTIALNSCRNDVRRKINITKNL